jgi:hypothetical protein
MGKEIVDGPMPSRSEEVLDDRVDVIMNEKSLDDVKSVNAAKEPTTSRIDIFADRKTSPEVSAKVLKDIEAEPKAARVKPEEPTTAREKLAETQAVDTPKAVEPEAGVVDTGKPEDKATLKPETTSSDVVPTKFNVPEEYKLKRNIFKSKWTWIALPILIIIAVAAVPYSRNLLLGLVIKENVALSVIDSKTSSPVSNADVTIGNKTSKTDAYGKVDFRLPYGKAKISIVKQYFTTYSGSYFVGYKSGQTASILLVATGRQVPITVLNKITGSPLVEAQVEVLDTTAKTDSKGQAVIVLPTKNATESASVSAVGYNSITFKVQITDKVVTANSVKLTPVGQIYFLSNLSGKIDVVKSDLDGANRQTVLAGTGKEDPNATILMASKDWHYLVLQSIRDTAKPVMYIIDTSTDKVTNFDSGSASFTPIGWSGHNFIYDVNKDNVAISQPGHESIKGYNADSAQLNLLDQNQEEGTATAYGYEAFYNFYIVSGSFVYTTQWYQAGTSTTKFDLASKNDAIRSVQAGGQSKKDIQTFAAANVSYIQAVQYKPQNVYYAVFTSDNKSTFYDLQALVISAPTNVTQATLSQPYPSFITSPLGSQSFWSELRDGKKSLFVGDQNGASAKQIAALSEYVPYGWYSDNYILIAKNSSELYITSSDTTSTQNPLKITDFYKSVLSYNGYVGQ